MFVRFLVVAALFIGNAACPAEPDRVFCEPGLPCASASKAHCAYGPEARLHGRATFSPGKTCVATDDAACEASTVTCALWGQCHAPTPGHHPGLCTAKGDRDFAGSRDASCAIDTCVAARDDCARARVCALEGRCTAQDGVCVADAESCRASILCRAIGWCAERNGQCRVGSIGECQRSEACTRFGNCALIKGACGLCGRSPECRAEGLCHPVAGRCAAFEPRHCQSSMACQRDGRCRLQHGACVR